MRVIDARNLIRFNTHMGMHICPTDCQGVVAFLQGYEIGTGGKCRFTEVLSERLGKRYRVKRGESGWPEQISRLADRRALDWMEVYLLVSSELLGGESSDRISNTSLTSWKMYNRNRETADAAARSLSSARRRQA